MASPRRTSLRQRGHDTGVSDAKASMCASSSVEKKSGARPSSPRANRSFSPPPRSARRAAGGRPRQSVPPLSAALERPLRTRQKPRRARPSLENRAPASPKLQPYRAGPLQWRFSLVRCRARMVRHYRATSWVLSRVARQCRNRDRPRQRYRRRLRLRLSGERFRRRGDALQRNSDSVAKGRFAGSARTTVSDRPETTGSRACARSMRSARAAGRDSREALRALRARRVMGRRDCRTFNAYPSPRCLPAGGGVLIQIAAQPGQLAAHDVLEFPLELQQQPELLV